MGVQYPKQSSCSDNGNSFSQHDHWAAHHAHIKLNWCSFPKLSRHWAMAVAPHDNRITTESCGMWCCCSAFMFRINQSNTLLGLLVPEDVNTMTLWNAMNYTPNDIASFNRQHSCHTSNLVRPSIIIFNFKLSQTAAKARTWQMTNYT